MMAYDWSTSLKPGEGYEMQIQAHQMFDRGQGQDTYYGYIGVTANMP
jgi:hypothetical protein